jgi:hypothetical protein
MKRDEASTRRLYPDVQLKDAINTLYINADSIVFGTDEETNPDNGDFVERKNIFY